MRLSSLLLALATLASAGDDRPMRWVSDRALQKRIHGAIDRGVQYLTSTQRTAGYWAYADARLGATPSARAGDRERLRRFSDPKRRRAHVAASKTTAHDGGLTAAVLYALGASGIKRDHPSVAAALAWIDRHPEHFGKASPVGTYASSFLVLALTRLDSEGFAPKIRLLADRLAASQHRNGMWGYRVESGANPSVPPRGQTDGSNTQLAVLALWAAHSLADWDSPEILWQRIEAHYRKTQLRNGMWGYRPGRQKRLDTMTAAGAAGYVYARAALDGGEVALRRARASATARRGLAAHQRFMAKPDWRNYYLVYSIERVGTVLGLSDLSWYERGARILVKRQEKDGHWKGRSLGRDLGHAYETSLAILFLSRATFPPRKGAVTPADRPVTITPGKGAPTLAKAKSHRHAFEIYLSLEPDAQRKELRTMGARGPGLIDHLLGMLTRDGRTGARGAAHVLLERLLDKRFLYMPGAPAHERKVMAAVIRATCQAAAK